MAELLDFIHRPLLLIVGLNDGPKVGMRWKTFFFLLLAPAQRVKIFTEDVGRHVKQVEQGKQGGTTCGFEFKTASAMVSM